MLKSLAVAFAVLTAILAVSTAHAATPFNAKSFEAAQAAGKPILIDVYASWCPVCRKQQPVIESLQKEKPGLVVFRVDYDTAKDVLRRFNAQRQGTLIMFKGKEEVGRLIYDADPERIRALVAKGF
jgi:thiol-disulfide isomerase/thioredoxin